jgi:hypothetical protein
MICLDLLGLVVHASFKFDSVVFHHLGLPLGISPLFLVLLHKQRFVLLCVFDSLLLDLVFEIGNCQQFALAVVFKGVLAVLAHLLDFGVEVLNLRLDLVALGLLNQDNVRVLSLRHSSLLLVVAVLNAKYTDTAVL